MLYNIYVVDLKIKDRIYGGLPLNEEMLSTYFEAKFQSDDIEEASQDLDLTKETEKVTNGFRADDLGVYFNDYQMKSCLKQTASLLRLTTQKRGSKQTVAEGMFVKGILPINLSDGDQKIVADMGYAEDENTGNILTDNKIYFAPLLKEPSGTEEFAGHVQTPQGARSILKANEYVEGVSLRFEIRMLKVRMGADNRSKDLTEGNLKDMLELGQEVGLGSNRSLERGKYKLVNFEKISD